MRETIIRTEQEQKGRRIMRDNSNGQKINFNIIKNEKGITLVALVITMVLHYDKVKKCSNSNSFLLSSI